MGRHVRNSHHTQSCHPAEEKLVEVPGMTRIANDRAPLPNVVSRLVRVVPRVPFTMCDVVELSRTPYTRIFPSWRRTTSLTRSDELLMSRLAKPSLAKVVSTVPSALNRARAKSV